MIGYGMLSKRLKKEEPSYPVHLLYQLQYNTGMGLMCVFHLSNTAMGDGMLVVVPLNGESFKS